MERLFKFTATLAFCMVTGSAMAVDGLNSTGSNPLPIGAGGETIIRVNPSGLTEFLRPTPGAPSTGARTAWINTDDGSASFTGDLTFGGTNSGTWSADEWSKALLFVANSGSNTDLMYFQRRNFIQDRSVLSLYIGDNALQPYSTDPKITGASGDAFAIISSDATTGAYFTRYLFPSNGQAKFDTSLTIGDQTIDETTVIIANEFKNCKVGETVVKTATGFGCAQAAIPKGTTCGGWGNNTMSLIAQNQNFPYPFPCDNYPLGSCPPGWTPRLTLERGMGNSPPLNMNTCVKD